MIEQPQANIELPAELARAIEQSRNIVTVNEAEALRLQELANSMKYTVNELHKEEVELEGNVLNLRASIGLLAAQEETLRFIVDEEEEALRKAKEDSAKISAEISDAHAILSKSAEVIRNREAEVLKKENALELGEIELKNARGDIARREGLIKEFASSL